jgi:tetratricopeptide (TPR) repeat protein
MLRGMRNALAFGVLFPRRLKVLFLLAVVLGMGLAGMHSWAWFHYKSALKALQKEQFKKAQAHIDSCMGIWSGSADLLRLAGRIARHNGDFKLAEKYLTECERLEGTPSRATVVETLLLMAQRGEVELVRGPLQKAVLQGDPDWPSILRVLCVLDILSENYGYAEAALQYWLGKDPNCVFALSLRGDVRSNTGRYTQAVADYERVLELDPDQVVVRVRLCYLLWGLKKVDRQAFHAEYLVKHHPKVINGWVELARCRHDQGQTEQAAEILDRVLKQEPDHTQALVLRAKVAAQEERAAAGNPWLRRAIELEPLNSDVLELWYKCLLDQGKIAEAEPVRERLAYLRDLAKRLNDYQQTLDRKEKPLTAERCFELAEAHAGLGHEELAVTWMYRSLQLQPNHEKANLWLSKHFEQKGDLDKAEFYRRRLQ